MDNTCIIAAGVPFDIGCRVVLWDEDKGLSFYKYGAKFLKRDIDLDALRKQVNCFVLHHSVTYTAKSTHDGLIGRGLSVNFIIDDNDVGGVATIYQCLDIKDAGYSHKPLNDKGPGVEISYQVEAWKHQNHYSDLNIKKKGVQPHSIVKDTVHGNTLEVYCPTDAQAKAVSALLWGFSELFPGVKPEFPKGDDGKIVKTTVKDTQGFLAHFNITKEKIDPSGFPFEQVEAEVTLRKKFGF